MYLCQLVRDVLTLSSWSCYILYSIIMTTIQTNCFPYVNIFITILLPLSVSSVLPCYSNKWNVRVISRHTVKQTVNSRFRLLANCHDHLSTHIPLPESPDSQSVIFKVSHTARHDQYTINWLFCRCFAIYALYKCSDC